MSEPDKWIGKLHVLDQGQTRCTNITHLVPEDLNALKISSWELINKQIVECRWDSALTMWRPRKVRFDKDIPNNLLTLQLTIKNIEEDISSKCVYTALKSFGRKK